MSSLFKIALTALSVHKVRTGLAVLGIMIGIASIIIVFSAGEGIKGLIVGQIESFGAEAIQTEVKIPSSKMGHESERQSAINLLTGVQVTTLTIDDMEKVMKLPNIKDGYGAIMVQEGVTTANEMRRTFVFGVSASFIDIDRSEIDNGRFFTEAEDKSLAQTAVLGSKIKEELFGEGNALGKSIRIRNERFRVIGVMKEQGAVMTMDFDEFIYIPVRTAQKRIMGIDYIHYMLHRVDNLSLAESTAEEMRILLRERHNIEPPKEIRESWADTGKDDFRVMTMAEIMDVGETITNSLTLLLLAIVAISLVVGGVGVMNVMYVIVNERTREIGLRKAVGASNSNIMWQFLIESVLITFLGGLAGVLTGILVSYFISFGAVRMGFDWRFAIPLRAFIVAFVFSIICGVIFGVFPARQAAKKDPIEALRYE